MAAGGRGQTCQAKPQGEEIKLTSRGRNAKKVSTKFITKVISSKYNISLLKCLHVPNNVTTLTTIATLTKN